MCSAFVTASDEYVIVGFSPSPVVPSPRLITVAPSVTGERYEPFESVISSFNPEFSTPIFAFPRLNVPSFVI